MRYLRILILRLLICAVASAGFIAVLLQIHDYPQTRQAFYDIQNGDKLAWTIAYYFVNEAGSGIKYALTGNEKYFAYFPTSKHSSQQEKARNAYRLSLLLAQAGNWQEQLHISHLYALGWGVKEDRQEASRWFLRAEKGSLAQDQRQAWQTSPVRIRVLSIIKEQVAQERTSILAQNAARSAASAIDE